MCGITGLLIPKEQTVDRSLLRKMNEVITHRGPDTDGFYSGHGIGLAMRRLKVIDLSTGDQPIHNEDKRFWIVFNGEIYNYRELRENLIKKGHRFQTHSDTEVILHQYEEEGEDCVKSFNGMFAFAIYDSQKKSLFIARDHLGIKPLYYYSDQNGFIFGSEIKSILQVPWVKTGPDAQSISHYLSLNYLPPPLTPFEGIRQLEPGHWMKIENGRIETSEFWEAPLEGVIDESEDAALKKIKELLHRSVERRLVADVPLGAFLSGGLDSSVLVALMKEHKHERIKTFSVGFEDPSYDETPYALQVAKYFGTDHYEIRCKPEDVAEVAPKIGYHADNLLADQAALPLYMVSQLAKEHVTVSLSGDGGDELFVGYPTFQADYYHKIYSKLPSFLRKQVIEKCVGCLPASTGKLSFDYKAKKFIQAGDFSPEKAHYWWRTIFTEEEKKKLFQPEAMKQLKEIDAFNLYGKYFDKADKLDFGNRALFADLKVWLVGNNLCKVDSMSMAHGLEVRVPFLDRELVEYMSRLPFGLKFKGRVLKYLLKKTMKGTLPESIIYRKKAGWHIPLSGWFRNEANDYLNTVFSNDKKIFQGLFQNEQIRSLLSEHASGKQNHGFKIWGLLILAHWSDCFKRYLS